MLLSLIAIAEPIAVRDSGAVFGCTMPAIVATTPRPGQTNVPVDVSLAFAVEGDCLTPAGFVLALQGDAGTDELSFDWADRSDDGVFRASPALAADSTYKVTIGDLDGRLQQATFSFTTGTGTVAGLTGAPSVALTSAVLDRASGELVVTYVVTPATDPQLLSMLVIEATGAATFTHVLSPFGVQDRRESVAGDTGELCIAVHEIDGRGVTTEGNSACIEVETTGCGCGSPGAPGAGLAALGLLALARRRR